METFLNEHSLAGQFVDMQQFTDALKQLNGLLSRIVEIPIERHCYFHGQFYLNRAIGNQIFSSSLKHIREKSVKIQFTLLLERLNAQQWILVQMQDGSDYRYQGNVVSGTTLAEHGERRIQARVGLLITLAKSSFAQGRTVTISKGAVAVVLDSVENEVGLLEWSRRHPHLGIVTYDRASNAPPPDHQTVLSRRSRFVRTKHVNQGRTVYLDRTRDHYWCVDNEHSGQSAHLEVFDADGEHVGEADLDGTPLAGTRDALKRLFL